MRISDWSSDVCSSDLTRRPAGGSAPAVVAAAIVAAAFVVTASALAAAAEQGELAAETLQHDLGGVALLAALVGPLAGLQLPLDVHRAALAQVLLGDRSEERRGGTEGVSMCRSRWSPYL